MTDYNFRYRAHCVSCGAGVDPARKECSYCLAAYAPPVQETSAIDNDVYKVRGRYEFGFTDMRGLYGAPAV